MKLVVTGTTFVDIKGFPLGRFDPKGRNAGTIGQFHGGVARNIAEDTAALGCDTTLLSLVDKTGIGQGVIDHLNEVGVNTAYIAKTDDGMGMWLAVFDENGEVAANMSARPNMLPLIDVIEKHEDEIFNDAKGLLIEMDMDEAVIARLFEAAEKHCVDIYGVISNMSIAKERIEYIRKTRCFICNRQESGILFGKETENAQMLGRQMEEMSIKTMVVTMDKEGAVYSDKLTGMEGHCGAKQVTVVDTTGAGDSFFAGVSAEMSRGLSIKDACRTGTEIAAKVIAKQSNVL